MSIVESIALGILQGATEFLPISSTGHLILARSLFGIDDTYALAFDAVLHLATAAAVILYFHKDIWNLVQALLRSLSRLPVNERDLLLLKAIAVGTVPAVLLGLSLESTMETLFRSPLLVAGVLVFGSLLFAYAEWVYNQRPPTNEMTIKKGLYIGLFQASALIPGMSRSGATIAGGMLLGLSRSEAARFAFLLAVPVILGAGSKKLLELITSEGTVSLAPVAIGAAASFVTGLIAIHFMLSFVRKYSLWPFIWYRLLLAGFVVFIVLYG
ncbi:MAG TPA: undecaprenyl-diphosphatase UppP [Candidatus Paceibacterota bacterium]|nr:undecaprenyl-diphosphatase UppP [Candidatus Paceibacterota bacterium]